MSLQVHYPTAASSFICFPLPLFNSHLHTPHDVRSLCSGQFKREPIRMFASAQLDAAAVAAAAGLQKRRCEQDRSLTGLQRKGIRQQQENPFPSPREIVRITHCYQRSDVGKASNLVETDLFPFSSPTPPPPHFNTISQPCLPSPNSQNFFFSRKKTSGKV